MNQVFQTNPIEPQISEELLSFLQSKFPLEGFKNVRGIEQLYRYQGAQDVIDLLKGVSIMQSQENLDVLQQQR